MWKTSCAGCKRVIHVPLRETSLPAPTDDTVKLNPFPAVAVDANALSNFSNIKLGFPLSDVT